jgi:hypothetical protein
MGRGATVDRGHKRQRRSHIRDRFEPSRSVKPCPLTNESEPHAAQFGYVVPTGDCNCSAALVADEDGVNRLEFGVAGSSSPASEPRSSSPYLASAL